MRSIFCVLICLISLTTIAQEKFIEVVVTDTLLVEPEKWNYSVYVMETYDETTVDSVPMDVAPDRSLYQKRLREKQLERLAKLEKIKKLAVESGAVILPNNASGNSYRYFDDSQSQNFFLQFSQRSHLDKFVGLLKQIPKANGNIVSTVHSNEGMFLSSLYKKVITLARKKAELIAALSNTRLGEILQVSEGGFTEKSTGDKLLEAMLNADRGGSAIPGLRASANGYADKFVLEKTIRVRFAMQ